MLGVLAFDFEIERKLVGRGVDECDAVAFLDGDDDPLAIGRYADPFWRFAELDLRDDCLLADVDDIYRTIRLVADVNEFCVGRYRDAARLIARLDLAGDLI